MWNYRAVRKKENTGYSYAIHEAYYNKDGFVVAITKNGMEPFGENIEELRHSWVMMAEAFGKPILDYENIPERECDRGEHPFGDDEADDREALDDAEEEFEKELEEWDEEKYREEMEKERIEKEKVHAEVFVGTKTMKGLVEKIYSDYEEKEKSDVLHD